MDEKYLELKFMEAITEANYHLVRTMLANYIELATKKKYEEFNELSEDEQVKLLEENVQVGKVFEMLSYFLTQTLNKKIEVDSASKAYLTETQGKKDGNK